MQIWSIQSKRSFAKNEDLSANESQISSRIWFSMDSYVQKCHSRLQEMAFGRELSRNIDKSWTGCECLTDCQNRVDELKEISDKYAFIRDGVYDDLIRSLDLITSIYHNIKETNQILLRYYREEFDENLQQFGFDVTFSDAEFDLGFGSDPDFDLIGESKDNQYYRHEEYGEKELQSKRKRHETLQFLLDLPESEWKNVAIDNQWFCEM